METKLKNDIEIEELMERVVKEAKARGWKTDIIGIRSGYEGMFIFDHSFAKAYFGAEWQLCLQEMVLKEEKSEYLKKFLEK